MKSIAQQIGWDFKANGFFKIYNPDGYPIWIESISGYWARREYDSQGHEIYFEQGISVMQATALQGAYLAQTKVSHDIIHVVNEYRRSLPTL